MKRQLWITSRTIDNKFFDSNMMEDFPKGIIDMHVYLDDIDNISKISLSMYGYAEVNIVLKYLIEKIKKGDNSFQIKGKRLILESELHDKKIIVVFPKLSEKHIDFLKDKKLLVSDNDSIVIK